MKEPKDNLSEESTQTAEKNAKVTIVNNVWIAFKPYYTASLPQT